MDKLKPCPFCGGEATVRYEGHANVLSVGCRECNIRTAYMVADDIGVSEAAAAWNRRTETVEPRTCKRFWTGASMICSKCGHQLNDPMANYCKTCGAKVVSG